MSYITAKCKLNICSSRKILLLLVLLLTLVVLSACGYRFAGSSANRLAAGEKVWVSFIGNETVSPTAQTVIRRAMFDQMHAMRGISPAASSEKANMIVNGSLRLYSGRVFSYTAADQSGEIRLTISVECELRRRGEAVPTWKGTIQAYQDYPASTDLALQKNAEEAALSAAAQKLAEKFITAVEQSY